MSFIMRLRIIAGNFEPVVFWLIILLIKYSWPDFWLVTRLKIFYILGLTASSLVFVFTRAMFCHKLLVNNSKLTVGYYNLWGNAKTFEYSIETLDELKAFRNRFFNRKGQINLAGPGLYITYRLFHKDLFTIAKVAQQYVELRSNRGQR